MTTPVGLHGHTHVPMAWSGPAAGCAARPRGRTTGSSSTAGRALLNPGSVGQPRDGDPRASYLVLDTDARVATWHRVAYDIEAVDRRDARGRAAGPPRGAAAPWPLIASDRR